MPQGSLLSGAASAAARATAARAAFFASGRRLLPPLAVFGCFLAPGWGWRRPGRAPFFKDFAFCVPQNPKSFLASQGRTVTGPRVRVVDTSKSPDRRVRASGTRLTQHTWFPKKGRSNTEDSKTHDRHAPRPRSHVSKQLDPPCHRLRPGSEGSSAKACSPGTGPAAGGDGAGAALFRGADRVAAFSILCRGTRRVEIPLAWVGHSSSLPSLSSLCSSFSRSPLATRRSQARSSCSACAASAGDA